MKLENVKKGVRVKLKGNITIFKEDRVVVLTEGMVGTILEDDETRPFVSWDNWDEGHDGRGRVRDNSCWSVRITRLKCIEGSV